ncbi:glycosyltransferase family 4 protein [Clostridium tetanomorphum]|uniref:Glycosyltransferase family 4 protein n=1 Tax=Clostridium tetanomorphum TaxID=1553 RepID=A0A923E8K1_CLOTT|nr:glycosyltransferase family 4 protein [Clostridium tetanomorphum]MBC2397116.1 glycosyltransferase family 4 protein [Clostridium tetanomorphum]NRZ99040.1 glycosyltransferase involved in cell wall biosynthesis [Clostridium tetanomorphum]
MKILFIIGFYMSNHSYRENNYVKLLKECGHKVKVVTSNIYYPFNNMSKTERLNLIKNTSDDECIERRKCIFILKDMVYFQFKDVIDDFKPDIIHLMEGRQLIGYFAAKEALRRKIPLLYEHEQRTDFGSFLGIIRNKTINRYLIKCIARKSHGIRTISIESLDYLRSINEVDKKVIEVSTLGFDNRVFKFSYDIRNGIRYSLDVKEDEFLIVTTGKFLGNKRLDLIVKSFQKAKKNNIKLKMIIVGEIKKEILENIYCSDIIVIPKLVDEEKLNEIYNASDLAIWTRYTISYFQSLGAGCPILVPKCKYTLQLSSKLDNNEGIYLFDIKFNQDEYLYKMNENEIINNISRRILEISNKRLNKEKINSIAQIFSWEGIIENLEQQYIRIINKCKIN